MLKDVAVAHSRQPELPKIVLPMDPVERTLIQSNTWGMAEHAPTDDQHFVWGKNIRAHDVQSAKDLIEADKWFVATVADMLRTPLDDSDQLLIKGSQGLLSAAEAYRDTAVQYRFLDFATPIVSRAVLSAIHGNTPTFKDISPQERSAREVVDHYTQWQGNLENRLLGRYTPLQQGIFRILNLPYENIAEQLHTSPHSVSDAVIRAQDRHDRPYSSTRELIVDFAQKGLRYDFPRLKSPLVDILSFEEFEIGPLLHLEAEEIASILNLPRVSLVHDRIHRMKPKLGARSTAELTLMFNLYNVGQSPSEGELARHEFLTKIGAVGLDDVSLEHLISTLTPRQQAVLNLKYLSNGQKSWEDIGKELDVGGRSGAYNIAKRGISALRSKLTTS